MYEGSQCLFITDSIPSRPFDVDDTRQSFTYQVMHQCPVNMCMIAGPGQSLGRRSDMPGRTGFGVDVAKAISTYLSPLGLANLVINLGANDASNADEKGLEIYADALNETLYFCARMGDVIQNITIISPFTVPDRENDYFPSYGVPDVTAFKLSDYRQVCVNAAEKFQGRTNVAVRYCPGPSILDGNNPAYWVTPHWSGLGHIEAATNFVAWMQSQEIFPASYT